MKKVLTYGTFDLFHCGHVELLKRAKALGDYLVVALVADDVAVKKHKEPYYDEEHRVRILESIKYVDEVLIEDSPDQIVEDIKKHNIDIFVAGDDLVGRYDFLQELCQVVYLPRTEGVSTTQIKEEFFQKAVKRLRKRSVRNLLSRVYARVRKILFRLLKEGAPLYSRFISCDDKTILFISFHGRGYSDNPKALHEYMLRDEAFKDYKFVWAINSHKKRGIELPSTKLINYGGVRYLYYLSKSKYWISNCKLPGYVTKNDNQVYLQTWHGTPLKRLAFDILAGEDTTFYRTEMSFDDMTKTYAQDVEKYNYMIAPNRFCMEVFQSAFRINKERLIETGYPRNDCLTNWTPEDVVSVKEKYGIPLDKKVVLYAPTWRDNSYVKKGYTFELEVDFAKWRDILGDEYVVVFKPHYLIISKFDTTEFADFVYEINAKADISELYIISDALVTDYSSVFFDYAILKRPMYFYMYDLAFYAGELRGFYIDINKDLPGEIFEQEERMLEAIKAGKYDYGFLDGFNDRFNNKEDGSAAKRVIDIVFGDDGLSQ